jgi:modulator of FtsH protease HflK
MTARHEEVVPQDARREHSAPRRLGWRARVLWGAVVLFVLLIAAYLATGFHLVAVDEQALVRRLGAPHARLGPGMHWQLPWPIDRVDMLKTTSVSKVGLGFALPEGEQETAFGTELLTGDTNILSIALVLQYVIRDPADFLLHVEDPRALIDGLGESVLTQVLAGMPVDEVLTTGRLAIQDRVKAKTQELLDRYRSGVQITASSIMAITLDAAVAQAFQEVADAMADRERSRNEARVYAANLLPKARGEAHTLLQVAQSRREQRIAQAVGTTTRLKALQQEYAKARDLTRTRLYLEAMEKTLPRVKAYILDTEHGQAAVNLRVRGR